MVKELKDINDLKKIEFTLNDEKAFAYEGETVTTAVMKHIGVGYAESKTGEMRGPVCNMGICYECSVYIKGRGRVKGCMTKVENGMDIRTDFNSVSHQSVLDVSTEVSQKKNKETKHYDVIVVGAGPAGLGAIEELSGHNLKVAIIDEQEQSGGQIFRQPPKEFNKTGSGYEFIKRAESKIDIEWIRGSSVWSIQPKDREGKATVLGKDADLFEVCVEDRAPLLAKRIILATGAYDRLLPVRGWETPGVMSAGGVQVFLKAQSILPGEKIVFAGSHPFLFIVAANVIEYGGNVSGIIFSQSFPNVSDILKYGVRSLSHTKKLQELLEAYNILRKAKVPIFYESMPISITEFDEMKKVSVSKIKNGKLDQNNSTVLEGDIVGMCYGFNASSELARQIGCEMNYDFQKGGIIAKHNEYMQTDIESVFVAGEIAGVGGAELSEIEGRLAANALLNTFYEMDVMSRINSLINQRAKWQRFANMLHEFTAFSEKDYITPLLQDENTYLCRCEQVKVKEVMEQLSENKSIETLNAVKLKTRTGMGLCQGRNCEYTLKSVLKAMFPERVHIHGNFTTRYPVRPIKIGDLIKHIED